MITLSQNDVNTLRYKGCIEGIRILSHVIADSANSALKSATDQPNYENVDISWTCDNESVYDGDLKAFVQYMLNREFLRSKSLRLQNVQYLNASLGNKIATAASGVVEQYIADLGVEHEPMYGEHVINIRMKSPFGANIDAGSYILFDFNKSDEIGLTKFKVMSEPVTVASVKSLTIAGMSRCIMWVQSDNQFIATNDNQFHSTNNHPVQNIQVSSEWAENMLTGAEMQVQNARGFNGVLKVTPGTVGSSVTTVDLCTMQKSIRLSDEEYMKNPQVTLKLATGSMDSSTVGYRLMYDLVTFDVASARNQVIVEKRLNPQHSAIRDLFKGQF